MMMRRPIQIIVLALVVIGVMGGLIFFADGDSLSTVSEVSKYDSSAFSTDTDNDGLDDGREIDLGTDPTNPDSDDDGLNDSTEIRLNTNPNTADTDNDGLSDSKEVSKYGTSPINPDTDGDGLLDNWEVKGETPGGVDLTDSNPREMDLYFQINYGENIRPLTVEEKQALINAWERMPVENPNGEQGINLHLDDEPPHGGHIDDSLIYNATNLSQLSQAVYSDRNRLFKKYYLNNSQHPAAIPEERRCIYRQSLFITLNYSSGNKPFFSTGRTGGVMNIVAGGAVNDDAFVGTGIDDRTGIFMHESLHNVIGELDDQHSSPKSPRHSRYGGYLSENPEPYLPKPLADELEQEGFANSDCKY